jgi:hypothetical protein
MIPLFAATSAIGAVDQVASTALSQWTHLAATGQAGGKKGAGAGSESFGALLSAHGVSGSGLANSGAAAVGQGGG